MNCENHEREEVIMQKKVMILLIATLMVCVSGCGKKESAINQQANDNTVFSMQVDPVIDRDNSSKTSAQSGEEIVEESVKFDCLDVIKSASPDSGLVQIDDMIFQYGVKFSEIANVVEQSECTYEAEYNVSSVVPAGETLGIRFYKEEKPYFMICVENFETETVELKECIVYNIRAQNASMGNAYYAGFSDETMNYTTVKDAIKDYEPEQEIFGSDIHGNKELGIMYSFPFQDNNMFVYFIFDGITNELLQFEIAEKSYDRVPWLW